MGVKLPFLWETGLPWLVRSDKASETVNVKPSWLLLSRFSVSNSMRPQRWQPTRLPIPGILQARTLEWVAISFSKAWKWKVKGKSLSCVRLLATPWTAAYQALPSMGFSRQSTGVGCHCLLWNPPGGSHNSLLPSVARLHPLLLTLE